MSEFLIIDVSNLAYRAAYANSRLTTSRGAFSGHVFGSVSSLFALFRNQFKEDPTVVFCYDGKNSKDYRRTLLLEYKANRTPHDIDPLPGVVEVLSLYPGIHIKQDDKEGDDAIAYTVVMRRGQPCVVWSGDKDIWALMQHPGCRVLSPNLGRFVECDDFFKHYHLDGKPGRIPLAKALFGDSSDGIKGVDRLQKKQVAPILNGDDIVTPEDFYKGLDPKPSCMTDNTYKKLLDNKDKVFTNYQVVLPQLEFSKESVTIVGPESMEAFKKKLVEYECFSLI
jgi:5'-3' exonuclease